MKFTSHEQTALRVSRQTALSVSKQKGLTLIEVMVTLSVAAVLLVVAVPNLNQMLRNNELSAHRTDLASSLIFARDLAVTKGSNVTVMSLRDIDGCTPVLDADGVPDWSAGWQVNMGDVGCDAIRSTKQLRNSQSSTNFKIGKTGPAAQRDHITFNHNGRALVAGSFTICDTFAQDNFLNLADRAIADQVGLVRVAISGRITRMTAGDNRNVDITTCL